MLDAISPQEHKKHPKAGFIICKNILTATLIPRALLKKKNQNPTQIQNQKKTNQETKIQQ